LPNHGVVIKEADEVMITRSLSIILFITSAPVFADTLSVGSVYFDSAPTLNEVIKLSAQHDNQGIARLIDNGHVRNQTEKEAEIVVISSGAAPNSPAEFRFLNEPTTYWTLTKNVTKFAPAPISTPAPSTPAPAPTAPERLTSESQQTQQQRESDAPLDDDNGHRIWHKVHGKWKWYSANKHHLPAQKTQPSDGAPARP
jgi:hypothetical protein